VSLTEDSGEVHIVVDVSHDLLGVAAEVRDVAEHLAARPVTVTVADISVSSKPNPNEGEAK
jgi:dienelactone hydrolase